MPGIPFTQLAEWFVAALESAGATVVRLSSSERRPLVLSVVVDTSTYRLEVYLWTITPGGEGRNRPGEWRIQRTSVDAFTIRAGVRTIMGGWHEATGTFAFWDARHHLTLAQSPSSQISIDTLARAAADGMATETRILAAGTEIAVAVQPTYLPWYIEEYSRIYDVAEEVANAADLIEADVAAESSFIEAGGSEKSVGRRQGLVEILRHFRDARFRPNVLDAYGHQCCMTGIALDLLDAAHIVPVSDPTGTDETRNGVALIPLLHRAYDSGLLGILPGGRPRLRDASIARLHRRNADAGLDLLRSMVPAVIRMPTPATLLPPDDYFLRGLRARGWTDEEIRRAS